MEDETVKKITVGMYDILDAQVGSIVLHMHTDPDDDEIYYHATVTLNIDDNTEDGCWLTFDTTINNPCKVCAAIEAGQLISMIAGAGLPSVLVFDENSDLVEEFDMTNLPPHLNEKPSEKPLETRVLH